MHCSQARRWRECYSQPKWSMEYSAPGCSRRPCIEADRTCTESALILLPPRSHGRTSSSLTRRKVARPPLASSSCLAPHSSPFEDTGQVVHLPPPTAGLSSTSAVLFATCVVGGLSRARPSSSTWPRCFSTIRCSCSPRARRGGVSVPPPLLPRGQGPPNSGRRPAAFHPYIRSSFGARAAFGPRSGAFSPPPLLSDPTPSDRPPPPSPGSKEELVK